jgi:hypothetical protein
MHKFEQITTADIKAAVGDAVLWERGDEHSWRYGGIISASLLERLCMLAARAPAAEKRKFLKELK